MITIKLTANKTRCKKLQTPETSVQTRDNKTAEINKNKEKAI